MKPNLWLCITTSSTENENIDEMTRDIWSYFDGITAVVHTQSDDQNVQCLLNERKGKGFVIERSYPWHHSHSKNEWLFDRRIRPLDICVIRDSCERLNPAFAEGLKAFAADLLDQNVWNLAQWSKLLMFRRWYGQQFVNGLHWGLSGLYGPTIAMEQLAGFENERDHAYSVRKEKRPPTHRYRHECLYLLDYGLNGNHLALFHQDPRDLDAAQWRLHELTLYLDGLGVRGVDAFIQWLKEQREVANPLDNVVRSAINEERPLRNAYRFFILGHTNEEIEADEDDWRLP